MKHGISIKCFMIVFIMFSVLEGEAWSETGINLNIMTILGSEKSGRVDPKLKDFVKQHKSVLRYSSYSLLSQDSLKLSKKGTGKVSLPGNRQLKIKSTGISRNRATLDLEILKNKKQIFQTVIQLRNNSSVTIGGPKYKDGDLLFNIFASF
jgi:hypothetical protein